MPLDTAQMTRWLETLLGADPAAIARPLEEYLKGIPRLENLADLPSGTPVAVRGDVDVKLGKAVGEGDERLRSMLDTLKYGQSKGWKQVIFGHIGRKGTESLADVARRFEQLLGAKVEFIADWLDESGPFVRSEMTETISRLPAGGILVLDNTRKYKIERVLWDAKAGDGAKLAAALTQFAQEFADKVARVQIHEALSAGSLDVSSTVLPAAMDRVALGKYVAAEFDGPMLVCRRASMVIFSGLKIDKLDDLEAVVNRGAVKMVFVAGSLAMALKKAQAQLSGGDFHLGVAEDPANEDKDWYISPARVDQAKRMLIAGAKNMHSPGAKCDVEFVLPVDFVLADEQPSATIGPGNQQFDIGPRSSELFSEKVGEFIGAHRGESPPAVVFHNGVFGWFERPPFHKGTEKFVAEFKRMKDAGLEVYVGGGEGGTALRLYGQPDWVTHCFTAGGTVLNALGGQPVPFLLALYLANRR